MSALYPCEPWPIDPACCPDWPEDPDDWDEAHFNAQWIATIELWRAVAGAVGLCRTTEAPCMDRCVAKPLASAWMRPWRDELGTWRNNACGCRDNCSCTQLCTVTLQGPVWSIEAVTVDGEDVPADDWVLLTNNRLARCGGCWPSCQNYCDGQGLRVTYLRGVEPGLDAIRAVSRLACKRLQECPPAGSGDCGELPSGVTSINREGLSMQLENTIGSGENGPIFTGIARVDRWIASINPYGITSQATVWSPDVDTTQLWETGPVTLP